jgi:hypothetical protein
LKQFQTGPDSFNVWQEGMHPVELFRENSRIKRWIISRKSGSGGYCP